MRTTLLAGRFLYLVFLVFFAMECEHEQRNELTSFAESRSQRQLAPRLAIKPELIQLAQSDMTSDEPITKAIVLTNRGDDILSLLDLESSCNCTQAELSRDRLKPGESAELRLTIHPDRNRAGEASVQLTCNDPLTPASYREGFLGRLSPPPDYPKPVGIRTT